jgi:hypothetical protein
LGAKKIAQFRPPLIRFVVKVAKGSAFPLKPDGLIFYNEKIIQRFQHKFIWSATIEFDWEAKAWIAKLVTQENVTLLGVC